MSEIVSTEKKYYICDPVKNVQCRKTSCKSNPNAEYRVCDRTSNIECSVDRKEIIKGGIYGKF